MQKAQVSLDYLLTLLAFLMVFAALLPFSTRAYHASVFALDSMNAKSFSDSVSSAVEELQALGNGSSIQITANPSLKWSVSAFGQKLSVSVESLALGEEKNFSIIFPNNIEFPSTEFDSKKTFLIKKLDGIILFQESFENSD